MRFISGRERGVPLTVAVSANPAGGGAATHRHSCGKVFVVYEGCGIYTVDGVEIRAEAGDAVFAPANTWHPFKAANGSMLRHVSAIWLPGDDLFGRAESELPPIAERSAAFAGEGADVVLLTDAVSPAEVASRITYWGQGG